MTTRCPSARRYDAVENGLSGLAGRRTALGPLENLTSRRRRSHAACRCRLSADGMADGYLRNPAARDAKAPSVYGTQRIGWGWCKSLALSHSLKKTPFSLRTHHLPPCPIFSGIRHPPAHLYRLPRSSRVIYSRVIHLCRLPSTVIHTEPIVCHTPAVRRTPPPCRNRLSRLPSRLPSCRRLPLPSAFIHLYRRRPRLCPSCVRAQPPHIFHAPARASTFCSGARRPQRRPERLRVTGAAAPELGIRCCLQRPASEWPKPEPGSFPDPAVSIPFARCRAVPFSYQSYHSPKKR